MALGKYEGKEGFLKMGTWLHNDYEWKSLSSEREQFSRVRKKWGIQERVAITRIILLSR